MADEFTPEDLELLDEIAATFKYILRGLESRACPYQQEEMGAKVEPVDNTASASEKNSGVEADHLVPCQSFTKANPPTAEVVDHNVDHVDSRWDLMELAKKELVETTTYLSGNRIVVDISDKLLMTKMDEEKILRKDVIPRQRGKEIVAVVPV